jgi:hypothetical protein
MISESMMAELEHEARLMRARNERLEQELQARRKEVEYWRGLHDKLLEQMARQAEDDWK